MTKIFLTGATGFIGGEVLHQLFKSLTQTSSSISCLVRNPTSSNKVTASYPSVRIVQGDLDDSNLIETEANNADVVLHFAATGHAGSSNAIAKGLSSSNSSPKHWIQISGATLLAGSEIASGHLGYASDKKYDDVKDISTILSTIKSSPKRVVDNLIIAQDPLKIKTALIVGPHIYGTGRGPANTRSIQAPEIARSTLKLGEGFRLNEGKNSWSTVHVADLASLVVELVKKAGEGKDGLWNDEGIYFPENGAMEFGTLSEQIAQEAHKQKLISSAEVKKAIDAKEADALSGHASILWGTNAVLRGSRARELLGWKPTGRSLEEEIPDIVKREAGQKGNL